MKYIIFVALLLVGCERKPVLYGQRVVVVKGFYTGCVGTAADSRRRTRTTFVKIESCGEEPKTFELELYDDEWEAE